MENLGEHCIVSKPAVWSIADAKAKLSELLRRASEEGPQTIGTRRRYVVVPEDLWEEVRPSRPSLGAWLAANLPQGEPLQLPDRKDPPRAIPFADDDGAGKA